MKAKGFTLIELLVVIAIIGLLATFATVQFTGARDKARIAKGLAFEGQSLRSVGDDLAARWDFDECGGGTAADSSGNGRDVLLLPGNAFSTDSPSKQGCSMRFDGLNSRMVLGTAASNAVTNVTVSLWAYITNASTAGDMLMNGSGANGYAIGVGDTSFTTPGNHFIIYFPGISGMINTGFNIGTGWHHIVVTRDTINWKLYIDGSDFGTVATITPIPSTNTLIAGSGGGSFFPGSLDNVRMYNRSLTSQEIRQIYAEEAHEFVAIQE